MSADTEAGIPATEAGRNLGPKPNMAWLPKKSLKVDKRYQRQLTSRRSKNLIAKLVENFCWLHAGTLVVTDNGDGTYALIDGQHRWKAACDIPEITLLPCWVHDRMTVQEQAHAFVAHNSDRVAVNPLAIFHAQVVAGEQMPVDLVRACKAAGVTIERAHSSTENLQPTETVALGVLKEIYRGYTDPELAVDAITRALRAIREAYPDKPGQMTSGMIRAVWSLLSEGALTGDLIAGMRKTDDKALSLAAMTTVQANPGTKLRDAYREALAAEATAPVATTPQTSLCATPGCGITRQPGRSHCARCLRIGAGAGRAVVAERHGACV